MRMHYINTTYPTGYHCNGFGFIGTGGLAHTHERFIMSMSSAV